MKYIFIVLFFILSCSQNKNTSRPPLTLAEFDKESAILLGILTKLVTENNPASIHTVSLGLESAFSLDCKAIGEECNDYHKILTKIIQFSDKGKLSETEKYQILIMNSELEKTLKNSRAKLEHDWKQFN